MKYIKKYDSYDFFNLKKYIIFDIRELNYEYGDITILQKSYYKEQNKLLMTKQLYIYDDNELFASKGEEFALFYDDINNNILYTSDDLNDCLKKLPLLINLNKYNI